MSERIEKLPAVYIMANFHRGTIYVGVTSDLWQRVWDHKNKRFGGFTAERYLNRLVWYEHHQSMEDAIHREKLLKRWHRAWKFRIIEEMNPEWRDLHDDIDPIATLVEPKAQPRPAPGGRNKDERWSAQQKRLSKACSTISVTPKSLTPLAPSPRRRPGPGFLLGSKQIS